MNEKGFTIYEVLVVLIVLCILALFPVLVSWTDGNLEWWILFFKGEVINVPWWLSAIVVIVFNAVTIAFNIITELCKLAL